MDTREVLAANLRARVAWHKIPQKKLREVLGWSERTVQNKLHAVTPLTADDLAGLAELFGLSDPGPLYRVPDNFGERPIKMNCGPIRSEAIRRGRRRMAAAA